MVELSEPPGITFTSPGAFTSVKPGALMVRERLLVSVTLPEVPVMVTVADPGTTELLAVNVSKLDPVEVGFGAKDAVTPLGRFDAARLTLPVNPYCVFI
jgi:hypothetical protein